MNFDHEKYTIVKFLGGSRLYGTHNEDSDYDIRAVVIPPMEYFIGLDKFTEYRLKDKEDEVYYDIRKFINLLIKGNPNCIELLFAPKENIEIGHNIIKCIIYDPKIFISKALISSHIGMAVTHLHRLEYPNRKCGTKGRTEIEKHGYNTKDAACIIRILRQCTELIANKTLVFPRLDAKELIDIRNGKFVLNQIRVMAKELMAYIRKAESITDLLDKPNYDLINKLTENMVRNYHGF